MKIVHVAVGVLIDENRRVLIALRNKHAHQGGLWEFPGGKCEQGERAEEALRRELYEEIGIRVLKDAPLCRIRHDYGDKYVLLDVRRILSYSGEPVGKEGQRIRWADLAQLHAGEFPAANKAIIERIQLADRIAISRSVAHPQEFMADLETILRRAPQRLHLRQTQLSPQAYAELVEHCRPRCRALGVPLVLHCSPVQFNQIGAAGVHVNSATLLALSARPVAEAFSFSASCHNVTQLRRAQDIGADYAFLSPVAASTSHPEQPPLGWERFASLIAQMEIPVYALGGMRITDVPAAHSYGAAGIAAISAFY